VICRIVAFSNHGNCLNAMNSSRSSTRSQKPSGETLRTSTAEMVFPRSADFIFILLEQPKRRRDLTVAKAIWVLV